MLRCASPHSDSSESPGVHQLTEDSLLFDGPRATYGRFRILHQIGAGSVGPVFRGEDSETRRPVVIKVIRVGLTPERVAVVGPALRALKDRLAAHPGLNPILETGIVDVEPFVVSPVVEGDSLDVALREYGPANMADALPRLRLLADALDAAAAVDVFHGSLHLRDIVVSVEATVITGIGLAAVLERVGVRPPVRRPYCAPEVALGRGISPAGDQYSLAAIAHEWLSGRRISSPGTVHVPTSSPEGAEALAAVFSRAMATEAGDRYPSATAFVEALADVADQVTPRAKTPRRKAAEAAPLLEFEQADEAPALTFGTLDDAPAAIADVGRGAADHDDDAVARLESSPESDDVPVELSLVTGPRDLGEMPSGAVPREEFDVESYHTAPLPYPYAAGHGVADADAHDDASDGTAAAGGADAAVASSGVPRWARWAGVIAAGVLVFGLGGRALLRWGTPSGSPAAETAAPATTAPGAAATPSQPPGASPVAAAPAASERASTGTSAPAVPARPSSAVPEPAAEPIDRRATVAPPVGASGRSPAPNRAPTPSAPVAQRKTPPTKAPARTVVPPAAARPATRPASRPAASPSAPAAPAAAAAPGRLLVRSTPSGAEVFVNGERRGVSPVAVRDLPLGGHAVRVVRPGFEPSEQRVVLEAGRPARALEVALTRSGAAAPPGAAAAAAAATATTGSLLIESRPSGAQAFVDGVAVGRTPVTVPAAAVGTRAVRIQLPGYLIISTTTRVEPGARARVAVTLTAERPR